MELYLDWILRSAGELNSDELERIVTIIQNPTQFKIPTWFLNRQKDIVDGKNSQILSNGVDSKLRDDLERLKKIRAHRGLRHYWGLRVRGQHTKTTGMWPSCSRLRGSNLDILQVAVERLSVCRRSAVRCLVVRDFLSQADFFLYGIVIFVYDNHTMHTMPTSHPCPSILNINAGPPQLPSYHAITFLTKFNVTPMIKCRKRPGVLVRP